MYKNIVYEVNMNSYETYLENLLEIKEREINMYKNLIENELRCRIQEAVKSEIKFDNKGEREVRFKVITIPQSQYIVKIDI